MLPEADSLEILTTCLKSIVPLPVDGVKKGKSETYEQQVAQEKLTQTTLQSLDNLLQQLLVKDFSSNGLNSIVKVSCTHSSLSTRGSTMIGWV